MIRIEQLKKSYGDRPILKNESFHFPVGERIAIIGDNGAGKTTLLNILCQIEIEDDGRVIVPSGCKIGYLPQEPNSNPEDTVIAECCTARADIVRMKHAMESALLVLERDHDERAIAAFAEAESLFRTAGGYELEGQAAKILVGLGFAEEELKRSPKTLSGGWRMRVELGKLFLLNPQVMILDEPTNHLDLPSLVWVERFLQTYTGTLIFVSHDRSLLNRLATMTLHLSDGVLTAYKGNYDFFRNKQAEVMALAGRTRQNMEKRIEGLQLFVDRFGAKASKAAQAQSKRKQIDAINDEMSGLPVEKAQASINFRLPTPPPINRVAYTIEHGSIGYDTILCDGIEVLIERGSKVAVIGANGIGKSTLLKTMVGVLPAKSGMFQLAAKGVLAYFAQDQLDYLRPTATVLDNVIEASQIGINEARNILGSFLFRGDDVFKPLRVLSGGEKSRVGLACILGKRANLLLLDEPTNHLDMQSIERLIEALKEYEGTMVFVSHDREFIDACCTHVLVMTKSGQSRLFEGNLADYQRLAVQLGFPNVLEVEGARLERSVLASADQDRGASTDYQRSKNDSKQEQRNARQKAKLEERIASLNAKLAACEEDLIVYSRDRVKCGELARSRDQLFVELAELEDEWLGL